MPCGLPAGHKAGVNLAGDLSFPNRPPNLTSGGTEKWSFSKG